MAGTMPPRTRTASRQTDSAGGDQAPQPSPVSDSTVIKGRGKGRGGRHGRGRGRSRGRGAGHGGVVDLEGGALVQDRDRMIIDSLANITMLLTNIVSAQR